MSMFFMPRAQVVDVAGRPYPGAQAYFYSVGTLTPLTVYSDAALTVALTQPVIADSAGIFPAIYTPPGLYKAQILDASGVNIWTQDNIDPAVSTSLGLIPISLGGTGAGNAATARANLGAAAASSLTATQVDLATNYWNKNTNPIALTADATTGTDDTKFMTPLKTRQALTDRTPAPHFWVRDEKASGTSGGTFTNGADQTRVLNTVKRNVITGASLATNQITLPAGTYWAEWYATAEGVGAHQSLLYNVTDAATIERGGTEANVAGTGNQCPSQGRAYFTLATSKVIELRHRCTTTLATFGFGSAGSFGTEVYAEVRIWQVF